MAEVYSYAEVVTDSSPQMQAYLAGRSTRKPGRPLSEYLQLSGGEYRFDIPISAMLKDQMRLLGGVTGQVDLLELADKVTYPVSLEHLRTLDPDTLIVCGVGIRYSQSEGKELSLLKPDVSPAEDRLYL